MQTTYIGKKTSANYICRFKKGLYIEYVKYPNYSIGMKLMIQLENSQKAWINISLIKSYIWQISTQKCIQHH